jgi:hypothetical protein
MRLVPMPSRLNQAMPLPVATATAPPAITNAQRPLPPGEAWMGVLRCAGRTARLLAQRRIHLPRERVGTTLRFADGTAARVYRESVVDGADTSDPCLLVVAFRLRLLRGRGHALFRWESILNTPLFIGFPGFVSKLWLAHDQNGTYRGVYQWNGPAHAERYARSLWRILAIGSVPGTIRYRVVPGLRRDDVLADPRLLETSSDATPDSSYAWWQLVGVEPR